MAENEDRELAEVYKQLAESYRKKAWDWERMAIGGCYLFSSLILGYTFTMIQDNRGDVRSIDGRVRYVEQVQSAEVTRLQWAIDAVTRTDNWLREFNKGFPR